MTRRMPAPALSAGQRDALSRSLTGMSFADAQAAYDAPRGAVHYLGTPYAQRTACGRYAGPSASLSTTATPTDVTCKACRARMV